MANKAYVELGLACADVCRALDPGTNGNKLDDPNQSMCQAIVQLTTWVEPTMRDLCSSLMMFPIAEL